MAQSRFYSGMYLGGTDRQQHSEQKSRFEKGSIVGTVSDEAQADHLKNLDRQRWIDVATLSIAKEGYNYDFVDKAAQRLGYSSASQAFDYRNKNPGLFELFGGVKYNDSINLTDEQRKIVEEVKNDDAINRAAKGRRINFDQLTNKVESNSISKKIDNHETLTLAEKVKFLESGGDVYTGDDVYKKYEFLAAGNPQNIEIKSKAEKAEEKKEKGEKLTPEEENDINVYKDRKWLQDVLQNEMSKITGDIEENGRKLAEIKGMNLYIRSTYNEDPYDKFITRMKLYTVTGIQSYINGVSNSLQLLSGGVNSETSEKIANKAPNSYELASYAVGRYFKANNLNGQKILQDVVTSIAQNAIPMLLAAAGAYVGGALGMTASAASTLSQALMLSSSAVSTFGNSYKEGLQLSHENTGNYNEWRSLAYALSNTASETLIEKVTFYNPLTKSVGKVSESVINELAKNVSSKVLLWGGTTFVNGTSEFTEEFTQSLISPILKREILGLDVPTILKSSSSAKTAMDIKLEKENLLKDALYDGMVGFATGFAMSSIPNIAQVKNIETQKTYGAYYKKIFESRNIKLDDVASYLKEISTDSKSDLYNTSNTVLKGDNSDYTVGRMMLYGFQELDESRKFILTELGKYALNQEPEIESIITYKYKYLTEKGYVFPDKMDKAYNAILKRRRQNSKKNYYNIGVLMMIDAYMPRAEIFQRMTDSVDADIYKYYVDFDDPINDASEYNASNTQNYTSTNSTPQGSQSVNLDFGNNQSIVTPDYTSENKALMPYVSGNIGESLSNNNSISAEGSLGYRIAASLKNSDLYNELEDSVIKYANLKEPNNNRFDNEYNENYQSILNKYKSFNTQDNISNSAYVKSEVAAELAGDYITNDISFVRKLYTENRNLFEKIFDKVKYLYNTIDADSAEARQLEKVISNFENVSRENIETGANEDNAIQNDRIKITDTKTSEIIKRLNNGEDVLIDEINAAPTISQLLSESYSRPETYIINTPERNATRKEIADKLLALGSATIDAEGRVCYNGRVKQERRADIVIGLPAAGKSSVLVEPLSEYYSSRVIDSDMAKEQLAEFDNGLGANAVHRESQDIIRKVLAESIDDGDNIIYSIVGGDLKSLNDKIEKLKNNGYSVYLHLNELSNSKAIGRALNRYIETGRFIPPQIIKKYGDKPTQNFYTIINTEGLVDGYSHYSNDVSRGEKPRLIEISENLRQFDERTQSGLARGGTKGEREENRGTRQVSGYVRQPDERGYTVSELARKGAETEETGNARAGQISGYVRQLDERGSGFSGLRRGNTEGQRAESERAGQISGYVRQSDERGHTISRVTRGDTEDQRAESERTEQTSERGVVNKISSIKTSSADDVFFNAERQSMFSNEVSLFSDNKKNSENTEISSDAENEIKDICDDLGISVVFEDLRQLKSANKILSPDGYVDKYGKIHLNVYAENSISFVFKHELTHFAEISEKNYLYFSDALQKSKVYYKWLSEKTGDKNRQSALETYKNFVVNSDQSINSVNDPKVTREIVADFAGDMLFKDSGSGMAKIAGKVKVKKRCKFIQFILDFISYIKKKLKGKKFVSFELSALEDSFERMAVDAARKRVENGAWSVKAVTTVIDLDSQDTSYCFVRCTDEELIKKANQMYDDDKDILTIWRELGVIRDPYMHWLVDIGLSGYRLYINGNARTVNHVPNPEVKDIDGVITGKLKDFVMWRELFERHPKLMKSDVEIGYHDLKIQKKIWYNSYLNKFYIDRKLYDNFKNNGDFEIKSVLAEQIQRAVQSIEHRTIPRNEGFVQKLYDSGKLPESKWLGRVPTVSEKLDMTYDLVEARLVGDRQWCIDTYVRYYDYKLSRVRNSIQFQPDFDYDETIVFNKWGEMLTLRDLDKARNSNYYNHPRATAEEFRKFCEESMTEEEREEERLRKKYEEEDNKPVVEEPPITEADKGIEITESAENSKFMKKFVLNWADIGKRRILANNNIVVGNEGFLSDCGEPEKYKRTVRYRFSPEILEKPLADIDTVNRKISSRALNKLKGTGLKNLNGEPLSMFYISRPLYADKFSVSGIGLILRTLKGCINEYKNLDAAGQIKHSQKIEEVYANIKNPIYMPFDIKDGRIYDVVFRLSHIGVITDEEAISFIDTKLAREDSSYNNYVPKKIRNRLKELGYDSIIFVDNAYEKNSLAVMVFDNEQIVDVSRNGIVIENVDIDKKQKIDLDKLTDNNNDTEKTVQKLKYSLQELLEIKQKEYRRADRRIKAGNSGCLDKKFTSISEALKEINKAFKTGMNTEPSGYNSHNDALSVIKKIDYEKSVFKDSEGNILSLFNWISKTYPIEPEIEISKRGMYLKPLSGCVDDFFMKRENGRRNNYGFFSEFAFNMINPLIIQSKTGYWNTTEIIEQMSKSGIVINSKYYEMLKSRPDLYNQYGTGVAKAVVEKIKSLGHDAILFLSMKDGYVAFTVMPFYENELELIAENGIAENAKKPDKGDGYKFKELVIRPSKNDAVNSERLKKLLLNVNDNTETLKILTVGLMSPVVKQVIGSDKIVAGNSGWFEKSVVNYYEVLKKFELYAHGDLLKAPLNGFDTAGRSVGKNILEEFKDTICKNEKGELLSFYLFNGYTKQNGFKTEGYKQFGYHLSTIDAAYDSYANPSKTLYSNAKKVYEECYVNVKNPYYISEDFETWTPTGFGKELYSKGIITETEYNSLRKLRGGNKTLQNTAASKRIRGYLYKRGYDSIVYMNKYRDPHSLTVVVFDTSRFSIVARHSITKDGEYQNLIDLKNDKSFYVPESFDENPKYEKMKNPAIKLPSGDDDLKEKADFNQYEENSEDYDDTEFFEDNIEFVKNGVAIPTGTEGHEWYKEHYNTKWTHDRNYNGPDVITDGSHYDKKTKKLLPNVKYRTGEYEYYYKTDGLGRITRVYAPTLKFSIKVERESHDSKSLEKQLNDQATHLIASLFGGSNTLDNILSFERIINSSQYKKMEIEWANATYKCEFVYDIQMKINYTGDKLRPSSIEVTYVINGVRKYQIFDNDLI